MSARQAEAKQSTGQADKERIDRELIEFLNGLRVVMPGVQVLFAFLLVVPFNQRFATISDFDKDVYFVSLCCTALAAVLLMTAGAYQRLEFRHGANKKEQMLLVCNRLSIVGLGFLALAMTGALLLVTDVLFSLTTAIVASAILLALFVVFWYVLPIRYVGTLEADD